MTETTSIRILPNPRRRPLHPAIDEAMIEQLVRAFYAQIRKDPMLAPIFAKAIPGDWEPHLQTMMAFWSSVMLMSGRYKGQPVPKHQALTTVQHEHFDRWLALFDQTAREICPPNIADLFQDRATQIADSLKRAMFERPAAETVT
ncbi:MAG: hypothetical protein GKS00_18975 [Alphaproteobacteria bacterium]|nr:hypothetical protein [Alphaproteobacteria bacterium]